MSKKTIISVVVFIFTTVTLYSPLFSNAASANTVSEKIADIYQQLLILKTNLFTSDLAVDDSQFPLTQASGRQGIIAYTGAESGKIDITGCTGDDCWREEIHDNDPYHSQAVSAVKGLARSGDYSMRIYWGPDWPLRGGKIRSELKKPGELFLEAGNEYWIGFSTYMRDNANNRDVIATDYTNAHIMQWHWMDVNGTSGINIRKGRYHFSFGSLRPETNIAPVTLGQWEDWVMHVKVTNDNTGFVRVWLNADSVNDKPVYEKTNVKTLASGDSKLNQKIGIYRWYGAPEAKDHYYEHFYDEFRIGNKNASFDDVKPGDGGGSSGTVNTQNNSTNNNQGTTNTPNTTNTTTNTFAIGNRVKVSADGARLAIRDTDGTRLGAQNDGALGTITKSSVMINGLKRWYVDFDSGADGYAAEAYLSQVSGGSNTTNANQGASTASLLNAKNVTNNSKNFSSVLTFDHLFDGCVDANQGCTSGNSKIGSFWTEHDLGKVHNLTKARIFGDADGTWLSESWTLKYKEKSGDSWKTAFSNNGALKNGWVEQTLNNLKARYVRIIVKGNSANGNTQAREIELYSAEGTDVSTTNANKATSNNSTNNQSSNTVTTGNRDNSLVDFFEDFEDGKLSDSFSCSGNCPTVSTEQALNGRYAMRSQVTSSMSNQKRAEVVPKSSTGVRSMEFEKDYWFGFSVYIPTNWTTPPGFEIPFQIHEPSGGTQPTLALYTGSGTWKVKTEGQGFGKDEKFLNKVSDDKGKWVDFVVQYRPSYKGTGVAKVWKDGSLVYSRTGNTAGNYVGGTYAKFGIYKGNLEDNNVLYHDDIRITANPKAGYKDVAP